MKDKTAGSDLQEMTENEVAGVAGGGFALAAPGSGSYWGDVQNLGFVRGTHYYLQRHGWL